MKQIIKSTKSIQYHICRKVETMQELYFQTEGSDTIAELKASRHPDDLRRVITGELVIIKITKKMEVVN